MVAYSQPMTPAPTITMLWSVGTFSNISTYLFGNCLRFMTVSDVNTFTPSSSIKLCFRGLLQHCKFDPKVNLLQWKWKNKSFLRTYLPVARMKYSELTMYSPDGVTTLTSFGPTKDALPWYLMSTNVRMMWRALGRVGFVESLAVRACVSRWCSELSQLI